MARPVIEEPETVEYRTARSLLSKVRALQLVRMYPDANWSQIMKLAKQWKDAEVASKAEYKLLKQQSTLGVTTKDWQAFFWSARLLNLCGFNHASNPGITRAVRRIPTGVGAEGLVTFSATKPGISLPFGMNDRAVFECLCTLAVKQKSPIITLDYIADLLRILKPKDFEGAKGRAGGSAYDSLYASLRRLAYCAMLVDCGDGLTTYSNVQGIIGAAYLPSEEYGTALRSGANKPLEFDELLQTRRSGKNFAIMLDAGLFDVLQKEVMPYPIDYIKEFLDIGDSLTFDIAKFLPARLHATETKSDIWFQHNHYGGVTLKEQLGVSDSNTVRVSERFQAAVRAVQNVWGGAVKGCDVNPFFLTVKPIERRDWLVPMVNKELAGGTPDTLTDIHSDIQHDALHD